MNFLIFSLVVGFLMTLINYGYQLVAVSKYLRKKYPQEYEKVKGVSVWLDGEKLISPLKISKIDTVNMSILPYLKRMKRAIFLVCLCFGLFLIATVIISIS